MNEENQTHWTCARCEQEYDEAYALPRRADTVRNGEDHDGETFCDNCVVECGRCFSIVSWDDTYRMGNRVRCNDCSRDCASCRTQIPMSMRYYCGDSDDYRCDNCSYNCDSCADRRAYTNDEGDNYCESCTDDRSYSRDGNEIDGYGHTRPSMWLGGPVRSQGGYYLGIELEISASGSNYTGRPVRDWASSALGNRDTFHCKEDSSVNGFEIVTEPMTPEYFEAVDWQSFFDMLNTSYPLDGPEPTTHGLHVHIGRQAFALRKRIDGVEQWVIDQPSVAAFSYLLAQDNHLERIGRRNAYHYCNKVTKPVTVAAIRAGQTGRTTQQTRRLSSFGGAYPDRSAINLLNDSTIEIRAFRSTRSADELRDAVRLVYLAAEYIRFLANQPEGFGRKVRWDEFASWVGVNHPYAYPSIGQSNKKPTKATVGQINYDEADPETLEARLVAEEAARQRRYAAELAERDRLRAERQAAEEAERQRYEAELAAERERRAARIEARDSLLSTADRVRDEYLNFRFGRVTLDGRRRGRDGRFVGTPPIIAFVGRDLTNYMASLFAAEGGRSVDADTNYRWEGYASNCCETCDRRAVQHRNALILQWEAEDQWTTQVNAYTVPTTVYTQQNFVTSWQEVATPISFTVEDEPF